MERNSLLMGFVIGAITPVLGFYLIENLFDLMTQMGWMDEVSMSTGSKRYRTMALLAICCNLIPFNITKIKKWDESMRGIVFPTLIYVGAWIYTFYDQLFV
ncbi:MAG TPA: hypothetical protein PK611_12035 [Saprospiraceae bacterium]|jgi:hypothetical protein|nr:hypothetical protein [Saprospiraceae bacterium]HRO09456.1 hypothetical protein [Saprospiraceae bacterium]HRO74397.1 hypothetical protein [Saprospiraceae bacterium]